MANVHKPDENIKTDVGVVSQTLNNGANTPVYYPMTNYDLAWYITHMHTNAGSSGSATLQMRQRVGAAGAVANLKASATLITANTLNVSLFARGEDFTATYTHIGLLITETLASAIVISSVLLRLRARYKQATLLA